MELDKTFHKIRLFIYYMTDDNYFIVIGWLREQVNLLLNCAMVPPVCDHLNSQGPLSSLAGHARVIVANENFAIYLVQILLH